MIHSWDISVLRLSTEYASCVVCIYDWLLSLRNWVEHFNNVNLLTDLRYLLNRCLISLLYDEV